MLNATGKKLIIIGGGTAAAHKLKNLQSKFDKIMVISEKFDPYIDGAEVEKVVQHLDTPSSVEKFIDKDTIVIIATDDARFNDEMRKYCDDKRVLFNSVDRVDSPFIFPAVFTTNGVTVAVSTEGRSPSFSKFIREQLRQKAEECSIALPVIEEIRKSAKGIGQHTSSELFGNLLDDEKFWQLVKTGKYQEAVDYGKNKVKKVR